MVLDRNHHGKETRTFDGEFRRGRSEPRTRDRPYPPYAEIGQRTREIKAEYVAANVDGVEISTGVPAERGKLEPVDRTAVGTLPGADLE